MELLLKNLTTYYNDIAWDMYDPSTGEVYVETGVRGCEITGDPNPPDDLEHPSFCLECNISDLADGPLEQTFLIPVNPVKADGSPTPVSNMVGVALNGVPFQGPAPLDLILSTHTLGMLDDCGAHANPKQGYHYHAATDCVAIGIQEDGHAAMIGFALDGFSIYANADAEGNSPGELDQCDGQTDDIRGYHYHAKPGGFNQIITCFNGLVEASSVASNDRGGGGGGRPDFTATAESLSAITGRTITAQDISAQMGSGGPPTCDDISSAAMAVEVTVEELIEAGLPLPPGLECDF